MNSPTKNQLYATLLSAGITLAVGILFTAKPDILAIVCHWAGGLLCAAGAVMLVLYFAAKKPLLTYGIAAAVAGILLLVLPGLLSFLIPIVFGLWILVSAASGIYRNFLFRHEHRLWWVGFLLGIVGAVIGVYVITRPVSIMTTTVRLIGIALILHAVLRLVSAFMARHYYSAPAAGEVIDITPKD